jgi:hypothetical protein
MEILYFLRHPIIKRKRRRVEVQLIGITPPHFCPYPKRCPECSSAYIVIFEREKKQKKDMDKHNLHILKIHCYF